MRDVMVDPKRSHADVVRDIMTSYDTVHMCVFVTADLCMQISCAKSTTVFHDPFLSARH